MESRLLRKLRECRIDDYGVGEIEANQSMCLLIHEPDNGIVAHCNVSQIEPLKPAQTIEGTEPFIGDVQISKIEFLQLRHFRETVQQTLISDTCGSEFKRPQRQHICKTSETFVRNLIAIDVSSRNWPQSGRQSTWAGADVQSLQL